MWIKSLILGCVGLFSNYCWTQQVVVLDSCQQQAQRNYPLIKQNQLIDKSTEFTLSNANKAYLPQFSISAIGGAIFSELAGSDNPNFKLITFGQLRQTIWDGGATHSQKEISKAAAEVEKANVDVQLYAIRERVNQLFFGVLLVDEQLKQLDKQLDLLNKNYKRIQALNASGLTIKNDLNMVQAEILRVEQKHIEFGFTRKSYLNLLSVFIGKPLAENSVLEIPIFFSPKQEIMRPELQLFASQSKLIETQMATDKVRLMPKIGIMGTGAFITPGINFANNKISSLALAGLNVSWELSGLYTHSNNRQLHQIKQEQNEIQKQTFLFNTHLQTQQSDAEIEKYRTLEQSDAKICVLRTSIRENFQKQYDSGSCSFNDWLIASEKETEAAATKVLHHVQLLLSLYQYNQLTGN